MIALEAEFPDINREYDIKSVIRVDVGWRNLAMRDTHNGSNVLLRQSNDSSGSLLCTSEELPKHEGKPLSKQEPACLSRRQVSAG